MNCSEVPYNRLRTDNHVGKMKRDLPTATKLMFRYVIYVKMLKKLYSTTGTNNGAPDLKRLLLTISQMWRFAQLNTPKIYNNVRHFSFTKTRLWNAARCQGNTWRQTIAVQAYVASGQWDSGYAEQFLPAFRWRIPTAVRCRITIVAQECLACRVVAVGGRDRSKMSATVVFFVTAMR